MCVSVASAPVLQGGPKSLYCLRGQDSSQVMTALIRGCREGMRGSVCALLLLLESKVATALDLALSSRGTQEVRQACQACPLLNKSSFEMQVQAN